VFQSGGINLIPIRGFGGTQAMLDQARAVAHTTAVVKDHYQFDYLMFNLGRAPLDELAVRRAIVRGIDGERLMRNLRGELHRAGSGDRLPGTFAYDPSIVQPGYDLAEAKRILDAAGWKQNGTYRMRNGKQLALEITTVAGTSLSERIGVQLQAALLALGIDATTKAYDYPLLLESAQSGGIWASGKFDITFYGWQPGLDDDHSYLFRCDTRPPNGENYSRLCDPAIDRDARLALDTTDRAVEAAADKRILRRIEDQADVMFLGFDREGWAWSSDLAGPKPTILGRMFWNIADWRFTR
jgi:peptide/nickel transport system substrate-binding protein